MIKIAELLKNTPTAAVDKIHELVHAETAELSPLELWLWFYRLSAFADAMKDGLLAQANADFAAIRDAAATQTTWRVTDFAKLSSQGAPVSWTYPAELVAKQAELKAALEQAKLKGEATSTTGKLNPASNQLFKVTLLTV